MAKETLPFAAIPGLTVQLSKSEPLEIGLNSRVLLEAAGTLRSGVGEEVVF